MSVPKPHWNNPYRGAIPVPIEELAECAHGLNERWGDHTTNPPSSFIMTKEIMLEHWLTVGGRFPQKDVKLDAYILPCTSGFHCIGIRYGKEDSQYLSPAGDQKKVAALLRKYT